jgi:hypothetical protein
MCHSFASQDIVKHIATGGYWFDTGAKRWIRAGSAVHGYASEHPSQAQLLGLPKNNDSIVPGEFSQHQSAPISQDAFRASNPAEKVSK